MVVQYLRDIKWNAPEMNLEGATTKLERIVKEMEILWCVLDFRIACTCNYSPLLIPATSKKQKGKDNAPKNKNPTAATSKDTTAKEIMYDNIFTSASPFLSFILIS
jgi:hypothetical protein